jgi:hypothetical protein
MVILFGRLDIVVLFRHPREGGDPTFITSQIDQVGFPPSRE